MPLHYVGAIVTLTPVAPVLVVYFVHRHIIGRLRALDQHCHDAVQNVLEEFMDEGTGVELFEERCTALRHWRTYFVR